ncbi:thioredoxin domain-containing protein [Synechococcus sp. 1G10]|uniref:thioredoxin domain-containing protein n=1 Tax=Synechococcus sp. 1G10 TaxID=2025605 RepID=UPI000B97F832|nr:thioredoxin domain-containing protein [Synechococcus sp. 1G10]
MTLPNPAAEEGSPLGRRERMILAALAAALALLLFGLRGGLQPQAPLEQLARRSPELPFALASGRPTIVEFYADWCEACRSMAPAMAALESEHRGDLNVVLLNVDNPRWSPEIDRYSVNGIPQLELFERSGRSIGRSLGARSRPELAAIMTALIEETPLPLLAGVGSLSPLTGGEALAAGQAAPAQTGPRSHG